MSRPPKVASRPVVRHGHAVVLKPGATTPQLFMFAGAGCEWREVAPLAALVEDPWSVIGIEAWRPVGSSTELPATVEEMAGVAHEAVRAEQSHGPYNLAGFSFGGLVAFEVASRLVRAGEQVQLLALIDCHMHHRFWSVPLRLHRTLNQAIRIARMPAALRFAKARRNARRIANRLVRRVRRDTAVPPTPLRRCDAAYAMYRPRPYPGRMTLLGPDRSGELGVDLPRLWRGYAGAIELSRVAGRHHELVRSGRHIKELARAVNDALRRLPPTLPQAVGRATVARKSRGMATRRAGLPGHAAPLGGR